MGKIVMFEGSNQTIVDVLSDLCYAKKLSDSLVGLKEKLKIDKFVIYDLVDNVMFKGIIKRKEFKDKITRYGKIVRKYYHLPINRLYSWQMEGLEATILLRWETGYDERNKELNRIDMGLVDNGRIIRNDYAVFYGGKVDKACEFYTIAERWLKDFGFNML